ncbi:MAG: hypothetical protein M0037_05410 [Betaproteobacteria bacterium]|nr:hypothetical protein [Betaproteobacteria bacterium]
MAYGKNKEREDGLIGAVPRAAGERPARPCWCASCASTAQTLVVEKPQRNAETIFLPCRDKDNHANGHAADTVARGLCLRRKASPPGGGLRPLPGARRREEAVTRAIPCVGGLGL